MTSRVNLPRLVVAAASSGAGKTTVATGLMAALRARGLEVSPGKVGPDYIDPGYHALATGRPGRNLDPVLVGAERVAPLLAHAATTGPRPADVTVVEGVMGLFDGRGATDEGSTAHVARLLDAPVVLVVDASSTSRSVAALVHGFATFDPTVRLAGVVLNRVGSDRHEELLRAALVGSGVPVLGVLRRHDDVATPSRHLGLVPVAERSAEAVATVERLVALVTATVDLDAVLAVARSAPPLRATAWDPAAEVATELAGASASVQAVAAGHRPAPDVPAAPDGRRPVVAVAGGPAFTFSYAEQTELLTAAGAEVAVVDPLHDEALPDGTAALVIGGGFPEVHAAELSANAGLRAAVTRLAATGAPVVAECAGLLYLARSLDGLPMCGVLAADATMTPRLTLGYRDAVAATDGPVASVGTRVVGHEFHRTAITPAAGSGGGSGTAQPAWHLDRPEGTSAEGFVAGSVHASYLHLHPAGVPSAAVRLVAAARRTTAGHGVVAA